MQSFGSSLAHGLVFRAQSSTLQVWLLVLSLTIVLWLIRLAQLAWHWPAGLSVSPGDVAAVLLQGARFDLKVSAVLGLLLWPLMLNGALRLHRLLVWIGVLVFVTAGLINLHYYGFYKTPIDPVIFGFVEDDTQAVLRTIWTEFPVVITLTLLFGLTWTTVRLHRALWERFGTKPVQRGPRARAHLVRIAAAVVLGVFLLLLAAKGTLRAMPLGRQHTTVSPSQFLNDMVPNGVIASKFAWDGRKVSQDFSDPNAGLRQLGFGSPDDAARVLGWPTADHAALRAALTAAGPADRPSGRHLLFFLMESWGAEPFLYHDAASFDVLGRLANVSEAGCRFRNFDAAQPGTHPSLEALLFSTPITPLTIGPMGRRPIDWAIPRLMQAAGYRTVFLTTGRAGWRDLDRVLGQQGFDEVIDATHLKSAYPEAELGIWGVWDAYAFRYLSERLAQPQDRPLFVFTLTTTNHPPYDLPANHQPVKRDAARWGGERDSPELWRNLDTWHYATDLLGGFVQSVWQGPLKSRTVIAATGDHNVRTFGLYATPQRRHLMHQVPFMIWGEGVKCGSQLDLPAGHRDVFPTLLPLMGIHNGYLRSGRDLLASRPAMSASVGTEPLAVNFFGAARSARGAWSLGNPGSFTCTPVPSGGTCSFDPAADERARAEVGLLDWRIRSALRR